MALVTRRRVLAAKIETTAGTAESLTATEAIFVWDAEIQADIPMYERPVWGALSQLPAIAGARKGTIKFKMELGGDGTTTNPKMASVLFPACGFSDSSGVLTLTSDLSTYKTVTIGLYESGIYKVLSGAMGTFAITGEDGKPAMVEFTFTGIWQAPTDAAMVALPSYPVPAPRVAAATLTIGGHTPVGVSKFTLDLGNTVTLIEDITNAAGYTRAVLTDRKPKGSLDPLAETNAAWAVWANWLAGTTGALSLVVGTATHNTVTIAAPACQQMKISEGNRNGLQTHDLEFQLASSAAADDELTVTWS